MRNLQLRCQELVENHPTATLLLLRLCYWSPRTSISRGGFLWVIRSRKEWGEESGLTERQCRTAIEHLLLKKVIVTEQHLFGRDHRKITFMRLSERGMTLLTEADSATCDKAGYVTPHLADSAISYRKEFKTGSLDMEIISSPNGANIISGVPPKKQELKEEDSGKEKQGQGLASFESYAYSALGKEALVVATVKEILLGKSPQKAVMGDTLPIFWKKVLSEVYGSKIFLGEFTMKDLGQFSRIKKLLGDSPARKMLEAVLKDWPGFVGFAKTQAGLITVPTFPMIGFVVKHYAFAVVFASQPEKPFIPSKLKNIQSKTEPLKQLTVNSVGDTKATKAELLSILGE